MYPQIKPGLHLFLYPSFILLHSYKAITACIVLSLFNLFRTKACIMFHTFCSILFNFCTICNRTMDCKALDYMLVCYLLFTFPSCTVFCIVHISRNTLQNANLTNESRKYSHLNYVVLHVQSKLM